LLSALVKISGGLIVLEKTAVMLYFLIIDENGALSRLSFGAGALDFLVMKWKTPY